MIMLGMRDSWATCRSAQVYIHGLVRDAERQKMSKTKGNTIDPLVVTEKYGTDAVRIALAARAPRPAPTSCSAKSAWISSRAFANKIWNAARFIFMKMETRGSRIARPQPRTRRSKPSRTAGSSSRLNETTAKINAAQENFRYHEVADLVWGFLWDEFCDWYVELKKLRIQQGADADAHLTNLLRVFEHALRLLHPVMPFLTEELWQRLVKRDSNVPESISIAAFPQANPAWSDEEGERGFALVQELVTEARALRAEQKLDPKSQLEGSIRVNGEEAAALVTSQFAVIQALTNTRFELAAEVSGMVRSRPEFDIALKLSAAQEGAEKQRLEKDVEPLRKTIESKRKQLGSESFIGRAPAAVVEETRAKLAE